jgi:ABC-type glycerol-3-phosphate transport system permease component
MATVAQPVQVTTFRRVRVGQAVGNAGFYVVLAVLSLVSMFPFVWTFLSSGKEAPELYQIPPSLWPANPQFVQNYVEIWTRVPFGRWLWNTFFVTVVSLIGTVISASLVGYSFARFRYPGRDLLCMITGAPLSHRVLPGADVLRPGHRDVRDQGLAESVTR